ncbi:unnamed protein product [Dicrocoelium dendriticum]|nr:unnamed protein product [Dicrocoelium dendriticum]CAH8584782.1 unnamed protein product [Dicrocoelium dendriticum]
MQQQYKYRMSGFDSPISGKSGTATISVDSSSIRAREPGFSAADEADARFLYGQRMASSSPDSDGSIRSTRESNAFYFDRYCGCGNQTGVSRRTLSPRMELAELSRCYVAEEEEADEQDSELNEKSVDSASQVPLRSNEVASIPEAFHRLSHSYVNEDQDMAICHVEDMELFYGEHISSTGQPSRDVMNFSADNEAEMSQRTRLVQHKQHPPICIEEPVPSLYPRQASFFRSARNRSQSNPIRDYVNIPEAALINWLATTVTTQLPILNGGIYYLGSDNRIPGAISDDRTIPPISYTHPPPPPPYRPHSSIRSRMLAHCDPLQPNNGTLYHVAQDSFAYNPFSPAGFTVISTSATCQTPGVFCFGPQWIVQQPQYPTDQHRLEPSRCPPSEQERAFVGSDADVHHGVRRGLPLFADIPPLSADFAITTAFSTFSPRMTAVSGWTMRCCTRAPPAIICDSLSGGPSKLDSVSLAGHMASDSSPSTQNPPNEFDINELRRENKKLRALLREATTRLQYVDVLEWHLQRLSVLVESMLASHHRQCELDHQLHRFSYPDIYNTEPRPPGPYVSPSMPPMEFIHHAVSASPGSLPSVPTFVPYCPVVYHPFHAGGSMGLPVAPQKSRVALTSAGYPSYSRGSHVHEMQYGPDFHFGRPSRPHVQAPTWPRTVSLDRVNGVGFAPGCAAHMLPSGWIPEKHFHKKKHTDHKDVHVTDDLIVLPKKQATNPPAPFLSVQVTRRRLVNQQCPSTVGHSERCTVRSNSGIAPYVKRRFPLSSGGQSSSRPIGVSLITRQPEFDEEETIKHLNPHTETLPVKVAVSSVYQVATAYRVCLADSGAQTDEVQLQSAAQLMTPLGTRTVQFSSSTVAPLRQVDHVFLREQANDVPLSSDSVLNNCENSELQDGAKSVGYSSANATTEADGSGSYEGISLPRAMHTKQSEPVHSRKDLSPTKAQYAPAFPTSCALHRVDSDHLPRVPSGDRSLYQFPCTPVPTQATHPLPLSSAPPQTHLRSQFSPEGRPPTLADFTNSANKPCLDPRYGWSTRPPVAGAHRVVESHQNVEALFTRTSDQSVPSQPGTPVYYRRPQRPVTGVPNLDTLASKSTPQVHFASPEPSSPPLMCGSPFIADPARPRTNSRNFTIDSIVSPHLLRKQYS